MIKKRRISRSGGSNGLYVSAGLLSAKEAALLLLGDRRRSSRRALRARGERPFHRRALRRLVRRSARLARIIEQAPHQRRALELLLLAARRRAERPPSLRRLRLASVGVQLRELLLELRDVDVVVDRGEHQVLRPLVEHDSARSGHWRRGCPRQSLALGVRPAARPGRGERRLSVLRSSGRVGGSRRRRTCKRIRGLRRGRANVAALRGARRDALGGASGVVGGGAVGRAVPRRESRRRHVRSRRVRSGLVVLAVGDDLLAEPGALRQSFRQRRLRRCELRAKQVDGDRIGDGPLLDCKRDPLLHIRVRRLDGGACFAVDGLEDRW
mmetsp:Transcript_14967/g.48145  ORF Transcript_14967/g.48145 Transcript_14967/m.48145 type:complete len:326 (-) Transcript_14967:252-1229(-)